MIENLLGVCIAAGVGFLIGFFAGNIMSG